MGISWRRVSAVDVECAARCGYWPAPQAASRGRPAQTALRASLRASVSAPVLGLVLAAGVCVCSIHPRSVVVRLCVRHASLLVPARYLYIRLRVVPGHFQHQSFSVVQAGLVLSAVRHGGARHCRKGDDSLEQGRPARAHLQSIVVSARRVLDCVDRHRNERYHVGTGNCEHAVLSSAHVPHAVSCRPAGAGSVWRDVDDDVAGCRRPMLSV